MKDYASYTSNEIYNNPSHSHVFNMIASCINSPSDHRIIIEQDEEGTRYYMLDFQDEKKSNDEYTSDEGCCYITHSTLDEESDEPDAMWLGGYENLYSVLDVVLSILDRGFVKIYTESY